MAVKKKARQLAKSAPSLTAINRAVDTLSDIAAETKKAVAALSSDKKKLGNDTKRLRNKRAALMKKKKIATARKKKNASADNKKAVTAINKDINEIKKLTRKVSLLKSRVSEELSALKDVSKRAGAYDKAVSKVTKTLNKPKKKRKKKVVG